MPPSRNEISRIRSLKNRKGRRLEGQFLAEGVRLLEEALAADYKPDAIFRKKEELSPRGEKLCSRYKQLNIPITTLISKDIQAISETKNTQGIIGLFSIHKKNWEQHLATDYRKILIGDKINDPGNLGTLMRSAVAFGFDFMATTVDSAEMTNSKTIRSSMGGFFHLATAEHLKCDQIAAELKRAGYKIILAESGHASPVTLPSPPPRMALVIGSEADGPDPIWREIADMKLSIPMDKRIESLNAGVAGSILMYELSRVRKVS